MNSFDFFIYIHAFKLTESYLELLLKLPNDENSKSLREELSKIHKRNFNSLFECKTHEQVADTFLTGSCELAEYYKKIITTNDEPMSFDYRLEDIYNHEVITKSLSKNRVQDLNDIGYESKIDKDIENDYKTWINNAMNNSIELNAMMK